MRFPYADFALDYWFFRLEMLFIQKP